MRVPRRVGGYIVVAGVPGTVVPPGTRVLVGPYLFKVRWPLWRMLLVLVGIRSAALRILPDRPTIVPVVRVM